MTDNELKQVITMTGHSEITIDLVGHLETPQYKMCKYHLNEDMRIFYLQVMDQLNSQEGLAASQLREDIGM